MLPLSPLSHLNPTFNLLPPTTEQASDNEAKIRAAHTLFEQGILSEHIEEKEGAYELVLQQADELGEGEWNTLSLGLKACNAFGSTGNELNTHYNETNQIDYLELLGSDGLQNTETVFATILEALPGLQKLKVAGVSGKEKTFLPLSQLDLRELTLCSIQGAFPFSWDTNGHATPTKAAKTLETLTLEDCPDIHPEHLQALAEEKVLENLCIKDCSSISKEDCEDFLRAHPTCKVTYEDQPVIVPPLVDEDTGGHKTPPLLTPRKPSASTCPTTCPTTGAQTLDSLAGTPLQGMGSEARVSFTAEQAFAIPPLPGYVFKP